MLLLETVLTNKMIILTIYFLQCNPSVAIIINNICGVLIIAIIVIFAIIVYFYHMKTNKPLSYGIIVMSINYYNYIYNFFMIIISSSSSSGNEVVKMSQNMVYLRSSSQVISQTNSAYFRKENIHIYDEIPYSTTIHLYSPIPEYPQNQGDTVPNKTDDISSTLSHPQSHTPDMGPDQSGEDPQNQGVPTKPDDISSNTTHPQLPTPEYEYMTPHQI